MAADEPIAIIGASCRLPGAPDLDAFWRMLLAGTDAVTEIPEDRWNKSQLYHPERGQRGKSYTFAAGVLGDVSRFDPAFFGISPREATQMDPQQRLLLELAYEAFEDAGLDLDRLAGEPVGVFVGGSSWDYLNLNIGDPSSTDAYSMIGVTLCSLSNRISYAFDLRGPSFTVDTACSSSLVALHQACEALRHGQVDMALVGGVSLLLAPQSFIGFSAASMLSPRGRCHSFDARADGYVRAEGGGVVVLKPLGAALADGDAIHAVIRGTGVNSDGRTTGFSLPNREAQAALLDEIYTGFGLDPADLAYVEAHGTGTPAGDPIEAGALGEALGRRRAAPLPIGSVKTNIGHLEAGSGMAGLLKAMLVAERGIVPPTLHCETPNPHIPFGELNLALATQAIALARGARPALVGINSFGFGGTNAHAVIEAAGQPATAERDDGEAALPPLLLSARSEEALLALAADWRDRLAGAPAGYLPPLVRGAARHRTQHKRRLVVPGGAAEAMDVALAAFVAGKPGGLVVTGDAVAGKVAFIFSGNGSQWAGMAGDAVAGSAAFRSALATVDAALLPLLGWSVADALSTPDAERLRHTQVGQPLLFAIQVAMVMALREHGVEPDACMGHSVGEVAAAWACGALDLDEAGLVIAARSRAQEMRHGVGAMAVLGLGSAAAVELFASSPLADAGLEIAANNAAQATTVAGAADSIARLEAEAALRDVRFTRLDLDYAFHSAVMDPIRSRLAEELHALAPGHATVPFVSTVTGGALDGTALDGHYWWRNVREPVLFADAARAMVANGTRIFVEIGPHAVLQAYLNDALRVEEREGRVVPGLSRRPSRHDPIALLAARCHAAGADIRAADAFAGSAALRDLPRYPWRREHYWVGRTKESSDSVALPFEHPLLGKRTESEPLEWTRHIGLEIMPWLADHVVGGAVAMPAAAMLEIGLAAARARHPGAAALDLLDVEIVRALVLEPHMLRELRLRIGSPAGDFELSSRQRLSDEPWLLHMKGRIAAAEAAASGVAEPIGEVTRRVDAATLYPLAAQLGLDYGPAFQVVERIDVTTPDDASVRLTSAATGEGFLLPPPLIDGALQGLLALAADRLGTGAGVVPRSFGRVRLLVAAGAVPTSARLRVTRVGPRSMRADVVLLDAADRPVAELAECWFVRVTLSRRASLREHVFHTASIPSHGARQEPEATAIALALGEGSDGDGDVVEERLLLDAYVTAVAAEALRGFVDEDSGTLAPQTLLRGGTLAADSRALLDRLLRWLAADGLAAQASDGSWTIDGDLPPSDAILRTLFFDMPRAVADIALLAMAGEALPEMLRDGPDVRPALPGALWDQVLLDSPASGMAAEALADAVARRCDARLPGRPLRILEVGARRGGFTRRLLRRLDGRATNLVAATTLADLPALTESLADDPEARAIAWAPGEVIDEAPFDLVIGLHAVGLNGWGAYELGEIQARLVPSGLLLLAEPAPNRFWQLLRADAPPLADARRWSTMLETARFQGAVVRALATSPWPMELVAASACLDEAAEPTGDPRNLVLLAAPGDELSAAVEEHLHANIERRDIGALSGSDAPMHARPAGSSLVIILPRDAPLEESLALIARLAAVLAADEPRTVMLICRGAMHADAYAAAIVGARRVLANEAAQLRVRVILVDPALPSAEAGARLAAELTMPDAEDEVAWSDRGRTTLRVRHGLPPKAARGSNMLQLAIQRPGLLDSLGWSDAAPAPPGPGEIAIDVKASGLNFRDVMWAMGLLPDEALLDGFAGPTLGLECAGVVTAVGDDVAGFAPGDHVMAFAPASLATHTVTKAHAAMPMPSGMDFAEGATVPVAFVTVAYALGHLAQIAEGETLLVHGGAGGVGLAAIQYARARGARVFATAGSPAKRALLRNLGVEAVLDSRGLTFADEVLALTGGEGVDIVLNSLAGEAMRRSLALVRPFGRFLELGKRDFYENSSVGLRPFRHNVSYYGIDADQLPVRRPALAASLFAELGRLFAEGALRPLPYRRFDFADAEDAFRLMQSAGHIGKIVLAPGAMLPTPIPVAALYAARADAAYVVTGGLDGFGREAARWLARHGARHLALLGRRGPETPGAEALVAEFAAAGVDARAYAVDVADEAALDAVLAAVRADQAPIAGVIHAAVAMDDALLSQLDATRFAAALRPKLGGADALDRLTAGDPIELFLLFSSVTTALGNPGQGNYVAANAAIEALAQRRHAAGLPALAVQWGPIGDAGYLARATQVSDLLARQLGGSHLTATEALDMLPMLLESGVPVAGLATVRWAALRGRLPVLASRLFDDMAGEGGDDAGEIDLRAMLLTCTPEEAHLRVTTMLVEEVARIMKLAADRVEPLRPLAELGMDSLMAVELRLAVEQRFGISVPLLALSEGATLSAMAGRIVRGLGSPEPSVDDTAQLAERMAQMEGGSIEGPADGAEAPAEPSFAAAAASSP